MFSSSYSKFIRNGTVKIILTLSIRERAGETGII